MQCSREIFVFLNKSRLDCRLLKNYEAIKLVERDSRRSTELSWRRGSANVGDKGKGRGKDREES